MLRLLANPWSWLILGVVLAGALGGSYVKGRSDGRNLERGRAQVLIDQQRAKIEALRRKSDLLTQELGERIEVQRNERDAETDHALAVLSPVRLCSDTDSPAVPATPSPAPAVDRPTASQERPVRTQPDIGPALVMLAKACQRDADTALAWQAWYAEQEAIAQAE